MSDSVDVPMRDLPMRRDVPSLAPESAEARLERCANNSARLALQMAEVIAERDRARDLAVRLENELAEITE